MEGWMDGWMVDIHLLYSLTNTHIIYAILYHHHMIIVVIKMKYSSKYVLPLRRYGILLRKEVEFFRTV